MTTTADRPVTLPSDEELEACWRALQEVADFMLDFKSRIEHVAKTDGGEQLVNPEYVPTFEDIGRMYSAFARLEIAFDEARGYFDKMRSHGLADLDYARLCGTSHG